MSGFWIGVLTAVILQILYFLYRSFGAAFGFSDISHIRTDLYAAVIEHDKNKKKIKVKIAYAGSKPLIVRKIELASSLSIYSGKESFYAWFRIARGFLTDDWEGLQAVFGQRFIPKEPVWLRKACSFILGISFSLFTISLFFNLFFGWIVLFFVGPYSDVKIISSDVNTKDIRSGTNQVLPFLVKPAEEREFLIGYAFVVKTKLFIPAKAEYVRDRPKDSFWKLPRPGHHVLRGNVRLSIKTQGLLATYRINLGKGKEDFVLIPQKDK